MVMGLEGGRGEGGGDYEEEIIQNPTRAGQEGGRKYMYRERQWVSMVFYPAVRYRSWKSKFAVGRRRLVEQQTDEAINPRDAMACVCV